MEVRNGRWLRGQLLDLLREHGVALVLNNYYTMPDLGETRRRLDPQTTDFLYIRFLGDRKKMDEYVDGMIERGGEKGKHWDRLVWDRAAEIENWARQVREMVGEEPEREVYAFFNNHYAGQRAGVAGDFRAGVARSLTAIAKVHLTGARSVGQHDFGLVGVGTIEQKGVAEDLDQVRFGGDGEVVAGFLAVEGAAALDRHFDQFVVGVGSSMERNSAGEMPSLPRLRR
ncbi:MAG: DUF72 domain-containing protein [Candidatus Latescibacterota bacterium]|nr:DUF72 domain-containing protein [Candidatus Latescibacterota bacterium]